MAFVLLVSLTLGGFLIWWHATQSVRTEMDAAFAVAEQSVGNAIDHLPETGDPEGDLKKIIATFNGDRHVRAALADDRGAVIAASSLAPVPTVPQWFLNLIGVTARIAQIPHPVGPGATEIVTLRTDPENEISEVWDDLRDNVEVMALFCVLAFPLIYWIVGRTLRPLRTLANAFPSLGSGDYTAHVGEEGTARTHSACPGVQPHGGAAGVRRGAQPATPRATHDAAGRGTRRSGARSP